MNVYQPNYDSYKVGTKLKPVKEAGDTSCSQIRKNLTSNTPGVDMTISSYTSNKQAI